MVKTAFIWLGSRRTRKHPISHQGRWLDIATSRGLPVPNGAILLHELYQLLMDEGVIQQEGHNVTVPDPAWLFETLYESVRFPRLDRVVAIRPAFSRLEQPGLDAEGEFASRLGVDMLDALAVSAGLSAVWSSALAMSLAGESLRYDVVVMEMVAVQRAGSARMVLPEQQDRVQVSGELPEGEKELLLPWLGRWQRPLPHVPPFAQRLQQLLRGVRRTFGQSASGGRNWVVEWADDGQVCWLLNIRAANVQPGIKD